MTTWKNDGYPPTVPNQDISEVPPEACPFQLPYPPAVPSSEYSIAVPPGYPGVPIPLGFPLQPPPPGFIFQSPEPTILSGENYNRSNETDKCEIPNDKTESEGNETLNFSDVRIRRRFIRRINLTLMVQIISTYIVIIPFYLSTSISRFMQNHVEVFIIALVIVLILMFAFAYYVEERRKPPMNIKLLSLFTVAEAFLLGVSASRYQSGGVLAAVFTIAFVCLAFTLFAFQTKFDFTLYEGFVFVIFVVVVALGLLSMSINRNIINLAYASIGALLFCGYLVYDIQLMMDGKHKYSISPRETIFGVLNLYVDIINILAYMYTSIASSKK